MRMSLFGGPDWSARSQRGALQNAQRAAIRLGQRRREREAVERDVAKLLARRSSAASSDHPL